MSAASQQGLIDQINNNIGIAHKICRAYFPDLADREDAFQEMMYQLWKSYEKFEGNSKFSTWMYRVCLNTAMTYMRKSARYRTESLADIHQSVQQSPPSGKEDKMDALFEAIAMLSPLNRAIVLLYLDEMSYEEIATATGLTRSNVSVRLHRIKKELEVLMKKKLDKQ